MDSSKQKPRTYRAILIDPEKRSIEEVQTDLAIPTMQKLIGADTLDDFGLADHGDSKDMGWVDDGGLQRGEPIHAFLLDISEYPIAGRCLVIGADQRGEECDAKIGIDFLKEHIEWLGRIVPKVKWINTDHGQSASVSYEKVQ